MYKLKEEYLRRIADDPVLQGRIAAATGKQVFSVLRWVDEDSDALTKYCVLNAIATHLNVNRIDSLVKLQLNHDKRKKVNTAGKEPE